MKPSKILVAARAEPSWGCWEFLLADFLETTEA